MLLFYRFRNGFFDDEMHRHAVYGGVRDLAFDQRQQIIEHFLGHVVAFGVDPVSGDQLLAVGDLADRLRVDADHVGLVGNPLKDHHHAGMTLQGKAQRYWRKNDLVI